MFKKYQKELTAGVIIVLLWILPAAYIFHLLFFASYLILPFVSGYYLYQKGKSWIIQSLIATIFLTLANSIGFVILTKDSMSGVTHFSGLFGSSYINYYIFVLIASIIGWLCLSIICWLGLLLGKYVYSKRVN